MKKSAETLRADIRRRVRREGASLAVICVAIVALAVMALGGALPNAGDDFVTSFAVGFLMGLLAFAAAYTVRQIRELRRALADDASLRRLLAKENDELEAHMAREVARTFVRLIPPLSAVIVVVAALVGREAMLSAVGTLLTLCTALLLVKLWYKHRLATPETE